MGNIFVKKRFLVLLKISPLLMVFSPMNIFATQQVQNCPTVASIKQVANNSTNAAAFVEAFRNQGLELLNINAQVALQKAVQLDFDDYRETHWNPPYDGRLGRDGRTYATTCHIVSTTNEYSLDFGFIE